MAQLPISDTKVMGERIADALREAIFCGDLRPGEHLQEERLAAEAGVSRGPVREALLKLEAEGLVIHEPYRGAKVANPSRRDLEELFALRAELEAFAARLAAPYFTPEDIRHLRELIEEERNAADQGVNSLGYLSRQFHVIQGERCPNRHLAALVTQLWGKFPKSMRHLRPQRTAEIVQEHSDILDAIEAGDPALAGAATARHIAGGARSLLALYDQRQQLLSRPSAPASPTNEKRSGKDTESTQP